MKERAKQNIGMIKKQVQVITHSFEDELWKKSILGEDTPDKLRQTVLFMIFIVVFVLVMNITICIEIVQIKVHNFHSKKIQKDRDA